MEEPAAPTQEDAEAEKAGDCQCDQMHNEQTDYRRVVLCRDAHMTNLNPSIPDSTKIWRTIGLDPIQVLFVAGIQGQANDFGRVVGVFSQD